MPGIDDIDRSREAMRRRIEELNRRHCRTARELQTTMNEIIRLEGIRWRQSIVLVVLRCFSNLVIRTPHDTGRARAGWTISDTGTSYLPPKGDYPPFNSDNENAVRAEIDNSLSAVEGQLTQADIIWVYNNVEYVLALDAGWSKHQAGNFIALFLQELKSRLDAMARAGGSR